MKSLPISNISLDEIKTFLKRGREVFFKHIVILTVRDVITDGSLSKIGQSVTFSNYPLLSDGPPFTGILSYLKKEKKKPLIKI